MTPLILLSGCLYPCIGATTQSVPGTSAPPVSPAVNPPAPSIPASQGVLAAVAPVKMVHK